MNFQGPHGQQSIGISQRPYWPKEMATKLIGVNTNGCQGVCATTTNPHRIEQPPSTRDVLLHFAQRTNHICTLSSRSATL